MGYYNDQNEYIAGTPAEELESLGVPANLVASIAQESFTQMLAAGQTLAAAREQLPNFDAYVPQMAQELQTPRLQGIARHDANVAIRLAYEEARARVTNSPPHTSDAAYSAWSQQNSPHAGAIQSGNAMQSKLGREAWVKDEIHRRIHHPDFDNGY